MSSHRIVPSVVQSSRKSAAQKNRQRSAAEQFAESDARRARMRAEDAQRDPDDALPQEAIDVLIAGLADHREAEAFDLSQAQIDQLANEARAQPDLAQQIVNAGKKRRGETVDDLPDDPTARAIVRAGCRRRAEKM